MSAESLWNELEALEAVDASQRVLVTLKDPGETRGYFDGRVLIARDDYEAAKDHILEEVEGLWNVLDRPITLASGARLPTFEAEISSEEDLKELLALDSVDFVEPADGFAFGDAFVCGPPDYRPSVDPRAADGQLTGESYPGADVVPYAFRLLHIPDAWKRIESGRIVTTGSRLPGGDQTIAVLDTGVASTQQQFFNRYARFYPRRAHLRLYRASDNIDDTCGHGTRAASVSNAPRDGRSIVGVAWGAPLISVKVGTNPSPAGVPPRDQIPQANIASICRGIRDAVAPEDGGPPAKVVAMAFGAPRYSPAIAECITTAFKESPKTIFVAAAGSFTEEVIFPAMMDDYVVATSVVEFNPRGPGYIQIRRTGPPPFARKVAYGPAVDFVAAYDENAIGIPTSGFVGNDQEDELVGYSMSSLATGLYAGLIAIASQYADQLGWSRTELMTVLRLASSREGITNHNGGPPVGIGAGMLDIYRAIGGARNATIAAPDTAKAGTNISITGAVDAVVPPGRPDPTHFSYRWTINGSAAGEGRKIDVRAPQSGTLEITLHVEDMIDGRKLEAKKTIAIQ